jgi:transposase
MEQQAAKEGSRPRSYTDEDRRQVVDMMSSSGRTARSVAAGLGIHHTRMSRWLRRYGQPQPVTAPPAGRSPLQPVPIPHADLAAEIARLRRENERLRMERDILQKRIALFAGPSR